MTLTPVSPDTSPLHTFLTAPKATPQLFSDAHTYLLATHLASPSSIRDVFYDAVRCILEARYIQEYMAPAEPMDDVDLDDLQIAVEAFQECYENFKIMLARIQRMMRAMKWEGFYGDVKKDLLDIFAQEILDWDNLALWIESFVLICANETNGILDDDVKEVLRILYEIGRTEGSQEFEDVTCSYFEDFFIEDVENDEWSGGASFMSARDYTPSRSRVSYSGSTSYTSYKRTTLDDNDTTSLDNLNFYSGAVPNKTYNLNFDDFIKKVKGDFSFLESAHNYIQFLFPVREKGLYTAQPLSKYEAQQIRNSPEMQQNVLTAYKMQLEFYGVNLDDEQTGTVSRTEAFEDRYKNTHQYTHNNLRITRILKFLGLVGFEHFKKPLILHWIREIFQHHYMLNSASACVEYWIPTLRFERDLLEAEQLMFQLTGKYILRKDYDDEEESWANVRVSIEDESNGVTTTVIGGVSAPVSNEEEKESGSVDKENGIEATQEVDLENVTNTETTTETNSGTKATDSNGAGTSETKVTATLASDTSPKPKSYFHTQPDTYPQDVEPLKISTWKQSIEKPVTRSESTKRKRIALEKNADDDKTADKRRRFA